MPIPKPKKGETEKEFIPRCISVIADEYEDNKQRVAICFSTWRKAKGIKESKLRFKDIL